MNKRKGPEVLLIALAVVGLIGAAMLLFHLKRHTLELMTASFLVAVGSAGAMIALEGKESKRKKYAKALCVGLVLAIGSLLTSRGFNDFEKYLSDRDMLVVLAAELMLNEIYLDSLLVAHQDYQTTRNFRSMASLIPPNVVQARLLLNSGGMIRHDQELRTALTELVIFADVLAARMRTLEETCASPLTRSDLAGDLAKIVFGEDGDLERFRDIQKRLIAYLVSEYPWCFKEVWTRVDERYWGILKEHLARKKLELSTRSTQ